MFVQPRGEPREGRRAGWSGSTAFGTGGAGGMPGGRAHRPRPVQPWVRLGRLQGRSGVAGRPRPAVRGTTSRGQARTAPPGSAASPKPRPTGDPGPDLRAARLQGADSRSGDGGGAAGPASPGKKTRSAASFPAGAGARLPRGRAARPPRLARCLFVSRRLPSSQTHGCWQEIGRARGSGPRRRGGEGAPRGRSAPGAPSPAGAAGDVLTSRQGKELDASKVLFTAGLGRSRADL